MTVSQMLVDSDGQIETKLGPMPVYFNVEVLSRDSREDIKRQKDISAYIADISVSPITKTSLEDLLGNKDLEAGVLNELFKLRYENDEDVTLFDTNMTSRYFNTLTHGRNGTYEPPTTSDGPFERKLREITIATWYVFLFCCSGADRSIG